MMRASPHALEKMLSSYSVCVYVWGGGGVGRGEGERERCEGVEGGLDVFLFFSKFHIFPRS